MKWKIVMDSSCDMRDMKGLPKDTEFVVVPMHIIVGDTEYVDKRGLNTRKMMRDVHDCKDMARTVCPGPEVWRSAFSGAKHVIVITVSGKLSEAYDNACAAKKMLAENGEAADIFILDSCAAGPEMGLIARKAKRLIHEGKDFTQVCQGLLDYRERTEVFCVLEKIGNLMKNESIGKVTDLMAGLLSTFVTAKSSKEGAIEMVGKNRSLRRTYCNLIERMKKQGKINKILISYCENKEGARELAKRLRETFKSATIRIQPAGGLCSFYAQERGLIVAYEREI